MSEIKKELGLENVGDVYHNIDVDTLIDHAVQNEGARISSTGALMIDTGIFTGRSPKDKYFAYAKPSCDNISWGDVNRYVDQSTYSSLKETTKK